MGAVTVRPRPRKRVRSVSKDGVPDSSPWGAMRWNIQGVGSEADRGRRVHSIVRLAGTISVCTNRLPNDGCKASAACGASTTSA